MTATASKEATLSEVLAEVSLLDLGQILKQALIGLGCMAMLIVVGIGFEAGANYAVPGFHVPLWGRWLFWLLVVWGWLASLTETKTYHHWEFGWYFPKLRWWGSLLLAVYILGAIKIGLMGSSLNWAGMGFGLWLYLMPFFLFLSVLEVGHNKLMQKREAAASTAADDPEGSWSLGSLN